VNRLSIDLASKKFIQLRARSEGDDCVSARKPQLTRHIEKNVCQTFASKSREVGDSHALEGNLKGPDLN